MKPLLCALAGLCAMAAAASAQERPAPVVGAIRWDAWVGDGSEVGLAVEKSLGPLRWHGRLPFFGKELAPDKVQVRANTRDVMDREIDYAANSGLGYWAFVAYDPADAMTRGGLDLYLSSRQKAKIKFCLILQGNMLTEKNWSGYVRRAVQNFREPSHQRVLGERPLLYIYEASKMASAKNLTSWSKARAAIGELRQGAKAAGLADPYIVAMEWSPGQAKEDVEKLGLDAVSGYCSNGGHKKASYTTLARYTQARWDEYARTGANVVPIVTAGWDRRPRVENPVPWEGPTPAGGEEQYYDPPTPAELAAHLRAAIDWNAAHPRIAPAHAVILYAWNEIDEGGYLVPTLKEGTARLDAIRLVLKPAATQPAHRG